MSALPLNDKPTMSETVIHDSLLTPGIWATLIYLHTSYYFLLATPCGINSLQSGHHYCSSLDYYLLECCRDTLSRMGRLSPRIWSHFTKPLVFNNRILIVLNTTAHILCLLPTTPLCHHAYRTSTDFLLPCLVFAERCLVIFLDHRTREPPSCFCFLAKYDEIDDMFGTQTNRRTKAYRHHRCEKR